MSLLLTHDATCNYKKNKKQNKKGFSRSLEVLWTHLDSTFVFWSLGRWICVTAALAASFWFSHNVQQHGCLQRTTDTCWPTRRPKYSLVSSMRKYIKCHQLNPWHHLQRCTFSRVATYFVPCWLHPLIITVTLCYIATLQVNPRFL